jgi:nucleoside 2-deoxyribosyltransferase
MTNTREQTKTDARAPRRRVYVASSWRNEHRQQAMVQALRHAGHTPYDFRNPAPGDHGFSWRQVIDDEAQLRDPRRFRYEVLTHPIARAAFEKDMTALREASVTVLVLPCGRSAHLELGFAVGQGKKTIVLLDDPMSEPELMYLMCVLGELQDADLRSVMCTTVGEVVELLERHHG